LDVRTPSTKAKIVSPFEKYTCSATLKKAIIARRRTILGHEEFKSSILKPFNKEYLEDGRALFLLLENILEFRAHV
jgi:hypothetical protein